MNNDDTLPHPRRKAVPAECVSRPCLPLLAHGFNLATAKLALSVEVSNSDLGQYALSPPHLTLDTHSHVFAYF